MSLRSFSKRIIQTYFDLTSSDYRVVRRNDGASRDIFFNLLKERGFKPKHILDIGANHGYWTRDALKYFPDAHYTLVEPQDELKTHVQDLLSNNAKIRWIGAGAGAEPGIMAFTHSYRDDSSSFVFTADDAKAAGYRQIDLPVTTLNEIVRTSDAPFPDMVKIDAEGLDLQVFTGASDLVGKTDIFLLEATICAPNFENTLANVIQIMGRAGYRVFDFTELNRSPGRGVLWACEVAFLRNGSDLLNGIVSYE
jgi:FkbM family methyltransferase